MVQLDLFDQPATRRKRRIEMAEPAAGKAVTSKLAAESLRGEPALIQRECVLLALQECRSNGATREELATATGLPLASICGRVNELLRLGLVRQPGLRRMTSSGRMAAVVQANGI